METIGIHSRPEELVSREETAQELPEISRQHELREAREREGYYPSAAWWYRGMVQGEPLDTDAKAEMLLAQKNELPYLISAVMERECNLSCAHCLYQTERSSESVSRERRLAEVIEHMVSSMPEASEEYPAKFMSAGRILKPWHLDIFKRLREARPDVKLGVIDNGTYTKLLSVWPDGFKLDWLDISVDGTEKHHNGQRRSPTAYAEAMEGLRRAREVVAEDGYVASLMTLTSINTGDVSEVARVLLEEGENGEPLADKLNLTTMWPMNDTGRKIEMRVEDFAEAWEEIKKACARYNTPNKDRVSIGLYRVEDVEKLAAVVGEKKFMESFSADADEAERSGTQFRGNFVETHIDGVPVSYLPISIWPPEELVIEADAAYRVAYESQFTLDEYRNGKSRDGRDTRAYTTAQLTPETDFRKTYERTVDLYWQRFGHKKLDVEFAAFERIRAKANTSETL